MTRFEATILAILANEGATAVTLKRLRSVERNHLLTRLRSIVAAKLRDEGEPLRAIAEVIGIKNLPDAINAIRRGRRLLAGKHKPAPSENNRLGA